MVWCVGRVRCMDKVRYHVFVLSGDCVLCEVRMNEYKFCGHNVS